MSFSQGTDSRSNIYRSKKSCVRQQVKHLVKNEYSVHSTTPFDEKNGVTDKDWRVKVKLLTEFDIATIFKIYLP